VGLDVQTIHCGTIGRARETGAHAGITQLRITGPGTVQVVTYNDTGHLPARLRVTQ
jgi:hypothetical protein